MNTRMLIAVVVSMFVCQQVNAQDADDPEAEATELEGTWEVVSFVVAGDQVDDPEGPLWVPDGPFWRFEGNRWYFRRSDDGNLKSYCNFSVDPSMMPAEIDITYLLFMPGIYEMEGDSLRICIGEPGGIRARNPARAFRIY